MNYFFGCPNAENRRTEKRNIDKKREPTLKPTRCFLFFCQRTFFKTIFNACPHLAHCLLPDTRAKTSQKSKSQIFTTHVLHVNRSLKNLNKCHFTSHIKESNFAYSKIFQKLLS